MKIEKEKNEQHLCVERRGGGEQERGVIVGYRDI